MPTARWPSAAARPPAWARRSRSTRACRSSPIPTTYAGSEMTPIYGLTEGGVKKTGRDARVLPQHRDLRPRADADAAAGAVGHQRHERDRACGRRRCTRRTANPIIALMAEEGIRALARALPALHADPRRPRARAAMRCTAPGCAARVLGNVGMGLHHKLCHTLGGSFNLPHAETHTVVLPHALAYNARGGAARRWRASRARSGAPTMRARGARVLRPGRAARRADCAASDIGMPADGLDRAADLAVQNAVPQPAAARARGDARAAAARVRRRAAATEPRSHSRPQEETTMTTRTAASSSRPPRRTRRGVGAAPLALRRRHGQDRLRVAADRPAGAVRRGRQVGHRPDEGRVQGRHRPSAARSTPCRSS